jgi:hypothetical protein
MTPTSDPVISALGPKAAGFFRSYRTAGLKAVEDAARDNDDAIEIYVTQSAKYVAGSWGSKFGHREARHASYEFAAFLTAVGIMALSLWGMWLACTHFGFSTIGMAAASVASIAALGALTLALAFLVATEGMHAPCKFCLAVSLWTRGWTPLSMEWFGADAGATWALGAKNIYIWQKSFDGWGVPELRVVRYRDIRMMGAPSDFPNFLFLSLAFELPQPRTEWMRFPEASNGMTSEHLTLEIVERASSFGCAVDVRECKRQEQNEDEEGETWVLYPPIRPPAACWRLIH